MISQSFLVGERVALWAAFAREPEIATVTRVTPSGRFETDKTRSAQFEPGGWKRGDSKYGKTSVSKLTPDLEARAIKARNLDRCRAGNWHSLNGDQLARVVAILDEPKSPHNAKEVA